MRKKALFKKIGMKISAIAIGVALMLGGVTPITQPIMVYAEEAVEEDEDIIVEETTDDIVLDDDTESEDDVVDDTTDDTESEDGVDDTTDDTESEDDVDDITDDTESEDVIDDEILDEELLDEELIEEPVGFSLTESDDSDNLFVDGDLGDDDGDDLWGTWSFAASDDAIWGEGGAVAYSEWAGNGSAKGVGIYYNADGTMTMSQKISSLNAGTYKVTGYVKDTNSKTGNVKGYYGENGDSTDELLTDGITSSFQEFTYQFTISEAQTDYVVGIQITTETGAWVCVDTMSLVRTADVEEPETDVEELIDNLFVDGDLGDDDGDDLWGAWSFVASDDAIWGEGGAVAYSEWAGNGSAKGVGIYYNADGTMTMSQKISSLDAGTYKVTGYVKDTNSKTGNVKGYYGESGDSTDELLTDGITSSFQEFTYQFTISEAQTDYVVGIQITTESGAWVCLDTLSLIKKTATSEEKQKTVALEELLTLINTCKALESDKDDYTEASYADLEGAILAAEEFYNTVLADLSFATLDEIKAATANLQTALDALVPSTEASVFVEKINLKENFIKGVDISSFVSEKDSGVTYYDFDGEEVTDQGFFDLLADAGVNWVRIRVWNNPYDASGNGYGGGNNDIEKAKEMGKLATKAGLKVLVDFHYSDFWADPAKQDAPKAWSSMGIDEKETAVYNYTLDSLKTLKSAGVDVRMVQVGNETNNGICGESASSSWSNVARIYNAGSKAVRDFEQTYYSDVDAGSEVRVALHFTEPNTGIQSTIASNLDSYNVDYDVFATSYYPFWHGTLSNLKSVLGNIAETYGKQVMVAETSYAYTFEDGDGHENNVRADQADSLALDYNISMQGQADAVSSVIETINNTTGGIGMFYWEPAWIPVEKYDETASDAANVLASNKEKWEKYGSGWAASYAEEYDPEDAGRYYGGSSWDNQALFDHDGYPMDSLNVFKYVDSGTTAAVKPDVARSTSAEFEYGQEIVLPSTVTVVYNDGSTADVAVTWNADQVAAIQGYGEYTINGIAAGLNTVCNVEVFPKNLLVNGGFEAGIGEGNGWTITCAEGEASMIKLDSKDIKRGSNALKFDAWSATLTDAAITQTVSGLESGTYACYMNVEGAGATGSYTISISAAGDEEAGTSTAELAGWMVWNKPQVDNIVVKDGDSITVTISITTTALETWGTIDEVYLYLVEADKEESNDIPVVDNTDKKDKEDKKETVSKPLDSGIADDVPKLTPGAVVEWKDVDSMITNGNADRVVDHHAKNTNVNITVDGSVKVSASVLQNLKGKDTTIAFQGGSGVALSISGENLIGTDVSKLNEIDLAINKNTNNIPASAVATKAFTLEKQQMSIKDTGVFPVTVNMHVAVGEEHVGKIANLYRYNQETGLLEYCGNFVVTQEGQAMFALKQGGEYLVTVTHFPTNETVQSVNNEYVVRLGDSLYVIARRNRMSLQELLRKNPQISSGQYIKPGQTINL